MAWNHYENIRRKVGCVLRVRSLSGKITNIRPADHQVVRVEVVGRNAGMATLHVWSCLNGYLGAKRFTVDIVTVPEDPKWVVERP